MALIQISVLCRLERELLNDPLQPDWVREGEYEGRHYRFDRAGNLVERKAKDDQTHFTWDPNQRLSESCTNEQTTHYQHDPLGRRVCKTTAGITSRFFWDGDALLGDVMVEENKLKASATSRLREWVYYPETFEPLAILYVSFVAFVK